MSPDPPLHQPDHQVTLLRIWLTGLMILMAINAIVANGIIVKGIFRPIPYIAIAIVTFIWFCRPRNIGITMFCSAFIAIGLTLRGVEILTFSEATYNLRARITGFTIWTFMGFTYLVFGFSSLNNDARRKAEEHLLKAVDEP